MARDGLRLADKCVDVEGIRAVIKAALRKKPSDARNNIL